MRKKEFSTKQLFRMQRRAIQYRKRVRSRCLRASGLCRTETPKRKLPRLLKRRLAKTAEPHCRRMLRPRPLLKAILQAPMKLKPKLRAILQAPMQLKPKLRAILQALMKLQPKLKWLWEKAKRILPRLTGLMKKLWKLLLFLQIPCRVLILILESLPQRIRRADWTPCEGN